MIHQVLRERFLIKAIENK